MRLLLFLLFPITIFSQAYKVADHPAYLERTISGYTEPSAFLEIEAEFAGRIEKIYLNEGELVTGTENKILLISQEKTLAKIEVEKVVAALQSEKQKLLKLSSEKKIAQREFTYRALEEKRLQKLAATGKATQSSLDLAQFEKDRAQLKVKEIDTSIALQENAILEGKVLVKQAEERLSRYQLYGPKDWVVNERYFEEGAFVSPGQKILQLVKVNELSVHFRLSADEIQSLRQNNYILRVKRGNHIIKAKIHHIDLNFDPISRKRKVEFRITAQQFKEAAGGIEVELSLQIPYSRPAVIIPSNYTFQKLEKSYIKLSDGKEIPLNPLRQTAKGLIIKLEDLPANAELMKKP